ncbi:transglycosylase domain-containing protein [Paenibacillus arenilitoris]|uniref:PBP1A family penicillin-binding protein n=1 Tax=Paenibacillus arenilitoris TaxID=2772299 RepID=A0A927CPF3_9BACL|nr:penicillin-binding protein 1A [Paenibacillus arenilitoris]MBD2869841.1 PBP1A family penicillin-binding protein [Paenibacillus arenilitoris]
MADRPRSKTAAKQKKKKASGRKWFYGLFFTAVIAIVCGIIGYLLIILNGERILAENGSKLDFGEASIIFDADGNEISRLYNAEENREVAEFSEIPEQLLNAIVATEDQRFYEHSGIDFFAIGRAVVKDVIARSAVEGGSTITQQLAKNVFLTADKTFFRKATEASIAVALEHQMSKNEILTMYLNRIFFGKNIYGVKHAASYYFDAELKDLELWQAATLAAMPKAPNRYNPIKNPEDSMNRRAVVLKLMYDQGYITAEEMEQAKAVVYEPPAHIEENTGDPYPAFVDFVVDEAIEKMNVTEEELRIGGYRIYTTLNQQAQKSIEKQFDDDDNFEKSEDERQVEAAMIIIDHRDGTIKGLTGGRDYVKKGLNRVNVTRQPGSSFKPIVAYGPALESGDYFPWTTLANDKKCFGDYCPYDRWGATPVSMTQAIKDSRNLAAVWMLNEIGLGKGKAFAEKLGFKITDNDSNLTLALGSNAATPFQMATAYSVFANGGKSVDPHSITKIEGKGNTTPYTYKAPEAKPLMSPQTAWYLTEMMQTVVQKGGSGARAAIDRPVAGKTGTTQFGVRGSGVRDAWFVGYTPEWTAAVWMGYDKTDENHVLDNGSVQSAALFSKVMRDAMKGVKKDAFKKPQDVQEEEQPPAAIENFNAVYLPEEAKVHLSWDPLPDGEVTYEVFRKEASEPDFIRFVDSLETSVDDMSAFPGMTYQYYVVAYDAKNDRKSDPSPTITVQIPETEIDIPEIPMEPDPHDPDGGEATDPGNGGELPPDEGETLPPELPDGTDPGGGEQPSTPTIPPDAGGDGGTGDGNAGNADGGAIDGGITQGTGG